MGQKQETNTPYFVIFYYGKLRSYLKARNRSAGILHISMQMIFLTDMSQSASFSLTSSCILYALVLPLITSRVPGSNLSMISSIFSKDQAALCMQISLCFHKTSQNLPAYLQILQLLYIYPIKPMVLPNKLQSRYARE